MAKAKYAYSFNCVSVPNEHCSEDELHSLCERMREINIVTFKRALGAQLVNEIRKAFGMQQPRGTHGVSMERDWHIRFGSVIHRGKRAYVMVHSAIEYVYIEQP